MDVKIIDKSGSYFVNPNDFVFVDPHADAEKQTRFEPGTVYKVKMEPGSWLEGQYKAGVLRMCDEDGNMEPVPAAEPAGVPVVAANAMVPAGTLTSTPAAAAPAPAPAAHGAHGSHAKK